MNCPQCGAEVPPDDAFCGKCGYAMRDEVVEDRTDQSRIRLHEEPTPTADERPSRPSSPRVRKHTMLGMPPASLRPDAPEGGASESPPPPPASIAAARAERRGAQKTMLGIPRPDFPNPPSEAPPPLPEGEDGTADEAPGRQRAHVRYDSVMEPPLAAMRRRRLFVVGALLVALSAGWLIYRFLNG